ncbi:MAG: lipopolysaccharide biosynthesis protein [Muribaculaceae bacterium]|nr:lipopolysaccharide biosynthesis protein [Muribaculaceae bacterium]
MASLKSLVKETAIYGMSSIVGRFLNYLLVPLYTAKISASSGGYGDITNMYANVGLLLVLLTFGMETAFFRFANKDDENPKAVYSTTVVAVGIVSLAFVGLVLAFLPNIAHIMHYDGHPAYLSVMAIVVAQDAIQSIPFAYLRYQKRPLRFATLKITFIVLNIALNLLYFVGLPAIYETAPHLVESIYDPNVSDADKAGYAFYINLACTSFITLLFFPEWRRVALKTVNWKLFKRMLSYGWPILVLGIAGVINQHGDKIMFPYIAQGGDAKEQLAIYGAAVKIAMIMAMITQAFRYAYEPFVFGKSRDKDNKETYSKAMKYFVIFTLLAFLAVVAWLDVLKYIIGHDYWDGLKVVPIVMAAEIMMGVYFNLSFWYKLSDRTIWGAILSGIGCAVLIAVNIIFVPQYGYIACAWGGFAGYGTAMVLSYFIGQHYYPINYPVGQIAFYTILAAALYAAMLWKPFGDDALRTLAFNTLLVVIFTAVIFLKEFHRRKLKAQGS